MNFRSKLLIVTVVMSLVGAAVFAWGAARYAHGRFDGVDAQRTDAVVAQFRRELAQRGDEALRGVQDIAGAETTLRMALDLNRPQADFSLYARDASGLATAHHLDFLELLAGDGSLISSAQWPGQAGNQSDWVAREQPVNTQGPFLARVDLPDGAVLAMMALRTVTVGDSKLHLLGGRRMGRDFLQNLAPPAGMRVLLYENLAPEFVSTALSGPGGVVEDADRFAPLVAAVMIPSGAMQGMQRDTGSAGAEKVVTLQLRGRQNDVLGVLLVGSDQGERMALVQQTRKGAALFGLAGILCGMLMSWWVSASVVRPLARLTAAAQDIAAGNLGTLVPVRSHDEAGRAARAFNNMTRQLANQRRESLQTERVAAWREIAQRLAHETKERLFPMQVALGNLRRAREQNPAPFDEAFVESLATLTAELDKLKTGVKRFSDFAKMPAPRLEQVSLNEALRSVVKMFEPQFSAIGRPTVTPELFLDDGVANISADPVLLAGALESLLLRLLDTMPSGGTLTIRTGQQKGYVHVEVCNNGAGLLPEECARMFTPYYATGQHSAGLGLATVQSVVSELQGRISVESAPGEGARFRIEFPAATGARTTLPPAPLIARGTPPPDPKPDAAPKPEPQGEPAAFPISYRS